MTLLMEQQVEPRTVSTAGWPHPRPALQAITAADHFQLQVQFVRAHGQPRGEVTTLRSGGVFVSEVERPR